MQILIEKDVHTRIPREVKDLAEARAFEFQGFVVHLVNDDGSTSPLPAETAGPESAADNEEAKNGEEVEGRQEEEVLTPAKKRKKG